ncbi:hypothetical protein Tco_1582081 [Tanacetum coccineum]
MSSSNNNKQPLDLTKLSPVVTGDFIDESSGAKHLARGNGLGLHISIESSSTFFAMIRQILINCLNQQTGITELLVKKQDMADI